MSRVKKTRLIRVPERKGMAMCPWRPSKRCLVFLSLWEDDHPPTVYGCDHGCIWSNFFGKLGKSSSTADPNWGRRLRGWMDTVGKWNQPIWAAWTATWTAWGSTGKFCGHQMFTWSRSDAPASQLHPTWPEIVSTSEKSVDLKVVWSKVYKVIFVLNIICTFPRNLHISCLLQEGKTTSQHPHHRFRMSNSFPLTTWTRALRSMKSWPRNGNFTQTMIQHVVLKQFKTNPNGELSKHGSTQQKLGPTTQVKMLVLLVNPHNNP